MADLRKKLLLSGLSTLSALALLEVGLRVAGYDPFGEMIRSGRQEPGELLAQGFLYESDDEVLVYELTPSASARAWEADITTNSHGFRDDEYPLEKPAGTRRIVALGDSATFGIKLPVEVLWPEVLEARLTSEGSPVEVLNLGIVGYDVLEEVAFLEKRGLAFDPDLVVVGFHVNDLGYASPTRNYIQRLRSYGSPIYRLRLLQYVRSRIDRIEIAREQQRLATEEYFIEANADYRADLSQDTEQLERLGELGRLLDEAGITGGVHRYVTWYASEPRVSKLRFALERLADLADEHDFEVLVFVIPWLGDGDHRAIYDLAYTIAQHEVERAGFGFLDPSEDTRARGHLSLQITASDFGHPNAEGHSVLADAVRKRILDAGYLEGE